MMFSSTRSSESSWTFKIVPLPQPLIEGCQPNSRTPLPSTVVTDLNANHVPNVGAPLVGALPPLRPRGFLRGDAVYMVGPHEFVHIDEWKPVGHPVPNPADHLPCVVLSPYTTLPNSHNLRGNEVRAGTGVVIPIEPDRPAIIVRIVDRSLSIRRGTPCGCPFPRVGTPYPSVGAPLPSPVGAPFVGFR